jgi:hypothetical protein
VTSRRRPSARCGRSARSVFGTRRSGQPPPLHPRNPSQPSAAPACQRATLRFGARRAYFNPRPLSRVTSERPFASAPALPPRSRGQRRLVGPSHCTTSAYDPASNMSSQMLTDLGEMLTLPDCHRQLKQGTNSKPVQTLCQVTSLFFRCVRCLDLVTSWNAQLAFSVPVGAPISPLRTDIPFILTKVRSAATWGKA